MIKDLIKATINLNQEENKSKEKYKEELAKVTAKDKHKKNKERKLKKIKKEKCNKKDVITHQLHLDGVI